MAAFSDNGGPYGGAKGEVFRYNTATGVWTEISPYPASSDDNFLGYSGLTIESAESDHDYGDINGK